MKRLFMVFAVLCVMQAAIAGAESFTDNGDGTVSDSDAGLMWQQGEPGSKTWDVALTYCEGLSLGGQSDWRLPNIYELESIINTYATPAIDTAYFPNTYARNYWSSTTGASSTDCAWGVYFSYGHVSSFHKSYGSYVRCVRGGQ